MDKTTFPYKRFQIGDWVKTTAIVEFGHDDAKKIMTKGGGLWEGKIVGVKQSFLGEIKKHSFGPAYPEDVNCRYLTITETVFVWKIAIGKLNKPLYALDENVEPIEKQGHLPIRKTKASIGKPVELPF